MAATLLAQNPTLARAGFVLLLLAAPMVAGWLTSRPRTAWASAGGATAVVVALTLLPDGQRPGSVCELPFSPRSLLQIEPLANIILFVPLAIAATAATRRPWTVFLLGAGASAAIEALQAAVPAIGRSCTSTDWVANTVGAGLGAALAWVGIRAALRRAARDEARGTSARTDDGSPR